MKKGIERNVAILRLTRVPLYLALIYVPILIGLREFAPEIREEWLFAVQPIVDTVSPFLPYVERISDSLLQHGFPGRVQIAENALTLAIILLFLWLPHLVLKVPNYFRQDFRKYYRWKLKGKLFLAQGLQYFSFITVPYLIFTIIWKWDIVLNFTSVSYRDYFKSYVHLSEWELLFDTLVFAVSYYFVFRFSAHFVTARRFRRKYDRWIA